MRIVGTRNPNVDVDELSRLPQKTATRASSLRGMVGRRKRPFGSLISNEMCDLMDPMRRILLILSLLAPLSAMSANAANYRCWSDPGFNCVIKIDVENKKVCSTGCGGANYECTAPAKTIDLIGVSKTKEMAGKTEIPATLFSASSPDGTLRLEIGVFEMEFTRPDFPQHMVSPANFRVNTMEFGYPTTEWSRTPDGQFLWDQDFYCLSERYFTP